jgi:hypothetical protein
MIERRDGPGPKLVICIITSLGNLSGDPAARLVSVYPPGLEMWRRLTDLCTAQTTLLRRAIKALERERDELNNRRALVQLELDRRPTRR